MLVPTRELAFQISEQIEALGAAVGVRSVVIVGGVDMMEQALSLAKRPHVVVASPGRIVDHLENTKGFNLRSLRFLVLDEADRLLNMDFETEIDKLLSIIPRERRTMLFSATMTSKVSKLQRASLRDPAKVEVAHKYTTVSTLIQNYVFLPAKLKEAYLVYLLNELSGQSCIIFCATCESTRRITLMLRTLGFAATPLHGKMDQQQRLASLNNFKAATSQGGALHKTSAKPLSFAATLSIGASKQAACNLMVCTDVASRGLDVPLVDVVLNYDLPSASKDYIHRVGRTARAGRSGRAITLVTQYDVELLQRIEALTGKKMELFQPMHEDAVLLLADRVTEANRLALNELRDVEAEKALRREKRSAPATDNEGTSQLNRSSGKINFNKKAKQRR